MGDVAILVEGLGKEYRLGENIRYKTLRESWRSAFRPARAKSQDTIWALRDVSFQVKRGEVVGVIGRNGAGKSTLLKILSQITRPTRGIVDIYGRVGSLLEVGTGFHPELTGRENIFLNGAMLGMTRREVQSKFEEIVDFAEIDRFLDTPVKRYSSGMYVRLAFAVAAHLEPEILIVDEVLAVGDGAFQKKCLDRMREVSDSGRTILFVSHNMGIIGSLCPTSVLLQDGTIARFGETEEVVAHYYGSLTHTSGVGNGVYKVNKDALDSHKSPVLQIVDIRLGNAKKADKPLCTGDEMLLEIEYRAFRQVRSPAFVVMIRDMHMQEICRLSTMPISGFEIGRLHDEGVVSLRIANIPFVAGRYYLDVGFVRERVEWIIRLETVIEVDIRPADVYGSGFPLDQTRGRITVQHAWDHGASEIGRHDA